jgi:hypothetical protein
MDVASLALLLCGDGAAQITGANLAMDGGWTAAWEPRGGPARTAIEPDL